MSWAGDLGIPMETLHRIVDTLGLPHALHQISNRNDTRIEAAVVRWRHGGALVDLDGSDAYQLVFNISGGQQVEIHSHEKTAVQSVVAGSLAIVCPEKPERIRITGNADTLQFLLTREWIESVTGRRKHLTPPDLKACKRQFQATAVQALVALSQTKSDRTFELDSAAKLMASQFVHPDVLSVRRSRSGLSPGSRRRVRELIDFHLAAALHSNLSVHELAAAARLSIHHFIRAFQMSEGETPIAYVMTRRMEKALMLLLRPDARVDEIADETGFSSPSHFVSAFHKRMGVTPGALHEAAVRIERD